MMKGAKIGLTLILVILCCGETSARGRRKPRHIRAGNICSNMWLRDSFQTTLESVKKVLENIKCRMDPDSCSDAMLEIAGSSKTPSIPVVCNQQFLNAIVKFLTESYNKVEEISHVINNLQNKLFLNEDDPLEILTNDLLNNIRVTLKITKPGYDVMQVTSSQQDLDINSMSALITTYTGFARSIEYYLQAAICVIKNN